MVKHYTKEDDNESWLKNLEIILKDENIPAENRAFVLRKSFSSEPLEIIESVPNNVLNNYETINRTTFQFDRNGAEREKNLET